GGGAALQPDRDAQGRADRGARLDQEPAGALRRLAHHGARRRARRPAVHARARGLCRPRAAARPAAPGRGRDRRPGARPARPRAGVSGADLMTAFWTLFMKETMRFWKVAMQTVAAPVLTSLLYLVIFGYVFSGRVQVY